MSSDTYRYGHLVWALWQLFRHAGAPANPPSIFRGRIARLRETDRKQYREKVVDKFAFIDVEPTGPGSEVGYTLENAFCIAIAMMAMDLSLNQLDSVVLVATNRSRLRSILKQIMIAGESANYHAAGMMMLRKEKDPIWDPRVYLIIEMSHMSEVYAKQARKTEPTVYWETKDQQGLASLSAALDLSDDGRPGRHLVIEAAFAARRLSDLLKAAPAIQRGRPTGMKMS